MRRTISTTLRMTAIAALAVSTFAAAPATADTTTTTSDSTSTEDAGAPAATSAPTLTLQADGSVLVSWEHADRATSYSVSRTTQQRNGRWSGQTLGETAGTSMVDDPGAGTHRYMVVAQNAYGVNYSAWREITVESGGGTSDSTDGGSTKVRGNSKKG